MKKYDIMVDSKDLVDNYNKQTTMKVKILIDKTAFKCNESLFLSFQNQPLVVMVT